FNLVLVQRSQLIVSQCCQLTTIFRSVAVEAICNFCHDLVLHQRMLLTLTLLLASGLLMLEPVSPMGIYADSKYDPTKPAVDQPPTTTLAGNHRGIHHEPVVAKFLPDSISQSDKLRAFLECRRECIAKCDRLVYIYTDKKEYCHDCIRQCMLSFLQQAKSLGIEFSSQPASKDQMQGDAPVVDNDDEKRKGRRRGGGRKRRRNKRKQRRERRRKEKQQRQALLKNCIVHK
ncbi:hypothetical protein BOX15_Mlig021116g2, partial [Macrostomum lignano]